MNLESACTAISNTIARMSSSFGRPVFDEWAVVTLDVHSFSILEYSGPRMSEFRNDFQDNLSHLREEMLEDDLGPGDFSFAREAAGFEIDAFIILGRSIFLFCNNTRKSIAEITRDPAWRKAQEPFVTLSEKFRVEPLEIG